MNVLAGLLEVEKSTYDESVWRCQASKCSYPRE